MENNEDDLKVFNKLLPDYDLGQVAVVGQDGLAVYASEEIKMFSFNTSPKRLKTFVCVPKAQIPFTL